ncbi:mobilization protein [uncultured Streptomyces sp.]|uniref:mobilization protein n=1 Tax=uncultured Streptomyces sp. TaxID=174707 RepID=UPI00261EC26F|nr:mobilization protein [uncultured Streptomyces sp.]
MMPKKADGGTDTFQLLEYLYGPGHRDEHTDPHLVAAWDPHLSCPARDPAAMSLGALALLLDAPVDALAGPRPAEHVWHVAVRNASGDRLLADAEWAEVAAAMVDAAGIAGHGDAHACRWVAVRHAPDHIHLVATLARADGRHPRIRGDIPAMHTAARRFEARWGLTAMSPVDRTARRAPTTGELAKADRHGHPRTAREVLQRTVREAAALADSDTGFLDRCRDAGLRVRERYDQDGILVGYAVALPGDRAAGGTRPVWFSGGTLAYDLSLPRIRERFDLPAGPVDWTTAGARIREAATLLTTAGRLEGAGDVAALGDLLAVAAAHAPGLVRDRLTAAAAAFEQAARAPGARSLEGRARAGWRASARALQQAPRTARAGGAPVVLQLLLAFVEAVEASRRWHEAAEHRAQARAAAATAVLLREAATAAGAPARPGSSRTTTTTATAKTATATSRTTSRAAGRGPGPVPAVTRMSPRPGPDRPGPPRTR